jgi:hypothetical protein
MLRVLDCPDLVVALDRQELEFGAARALAPLLPDDWRRRTWGELILRRGHHAWESQLV